MEFKRQYIVNENNQKIAVQLDIDTFEKIENILENYALAKLINDEDSETLNIEKDKKNIYQRPKSGIKLSPEEKLKLIKEYFEYYEKSAKESPNILNSKLSRTAFDELLNKIGFLVLSETEKLLKTDNEVMVFLKQNPLPTGFEKHLPENFRIYCLALNAIKQWLSAEQLATDRFVLGGTARTQYKNLGKRCLVSGKSSNECVIELHHPVRDGRPPIPLSKDAHAQIEGQIMSSDRDDSDEIKNAIYPIKKLGNRSWIMLKLGCELLLEKEPSINKNKNIQSSSKTFARKACDASDKSPQEILDWLIQKNLT